MVDEPLDFDPTEVSTLSSSRAPSGGRAQGSRSARRPPLGARPGVKAEAVARSFDPEQEAGAARREDVSSEGQLLLHSPGTTGEAAGVATTAATAAGSWLQLPARGRVDGRSRIDPPSSSDDDAADERPVISFARAATHAIGSLRGACEWRRSAGTMILRASV